MPYVKKIAAGLLAVVMLFSAMPVPALATETEVITEPEDTTEPKTEEGECQHQYVAAVTKPTCVKGGFTTYTCPLCRDTYTADAVDPTGVCRLEQVEAEDATCQETGILAHYSCKDCGAVYLDAEGKQPVADEAVILPFAACTPEPVAEVPATCTQTGMAAHFRCGLCEDLYWDAEGKEPVAGEAELVLPMQGHEFGDWEVVEFPGPDVVGMEARHCLNCEAQEMQEIPALSCDLAAPKLTVTLDSETGMPLLSWTQVPGAEAYLVYRGVEGSEEVEFLGALEELSGVDITAQPGFSYFYTVMALSSTSYGELSEFQYYMLKCQKPVVTVASDPVSGKPSLTWEAVEGAMKYEVYRSTSSSKNFKLVATTEEPAAVVTSSSVGTKYYYKVKAICANPEANSPYSAVVSHICDCAQPVVTLTSGATSGIKVSWEKVTGAKKYQVYRASSENGTYSKIATTTSTSYTDTKAPKNQISYYKVSAYGSDTNSLSAYSEIVSLMNHTFGSWKTIVPSTPEEEGFKERTCSVCGHVEGQITPVLTRSLSTPKLTLSNDAATGKPKLSWGSIKGASKYYIYQVDVATGEKTYLAETTAKSYTPADTVVGTTYSYQIIAISDTKCSNYSTVKSIVCKCAKPKLSFETEPVSGKPIAKWEAVEGAVKYEVYRSTSSSKNFKLVAETSELSVIIDSSTAGKTYYYRLVAIGAAEGTASANSATVKHICDCAQPVVTLTSGTSSGIKVSWEKVTGAKKYQVYRASSENGTYSKIATTTSTSYTDTKAPKNQMSYYKVRAYGSDTNSLSAYSEVVSLMNHTFGSWQTVVPNSPEAEGLEERVCTYCGEKEQRVTAKLERTLATPKISITSEVKSGKPTLIWSPISKATGYRIYLVNPDTGVYEFLTNTETYTFVHEDAQPGSQYTYCVVAVNATNCSDYSECLTALCRCEVPQIKITMEKETNALILTWEQAENAVGYDIYRSASLNSGYELYTSTQELTVTVADNIPGVPQYFKIQAIHNNGADSILGAAVSLDGECSELVIHAGTISAKCNKVVWGKIKDAKSYQVYRATSLNGSYSKIATVKSSEHVDLNITEGITYYYRVKAYDSKNNLLTTSQDEAADKPCAVPVKIYISPSSQTDNKYSYGNTTEAKECRKIGLATVEALQRCGFDAMTNVTQDMYSRMPESNAWGANLHVPIHSNAFNGSAMGTQIYHDGVSGSVSSKACKAIFKELAPLSPGTSGESMRKHSDYYEFNKSNAPTAYIEVAFHDTKTEAKWIINNTQKIAEAICKGICNTYGITYIAP